MALSVFPWVQNGPASPREFSQHQLVNFRNFVNHLEETIVLFFPSFHPSDILNINSKQFSTIINQIANIRKSSETYF